MTTEAREQAGAQPGRGRGGWRSSGPVDGPVPQTPLSAVLVVGSALVVATVVATILQGGVGVTDASPVYLLAVVVASALFGTTAAVVTSLLSVLLYDFLFTEPRLTLAVADPQEWLSLLLFLVVAVVIGRFAALLRQRAQEARSNESEARSLFAISHSIATAASLASAAEEIVSLLRVEAGLERVWVVLGGAGETRILADSGAGADRADPTRPVREPSQAPISWILRRRPGDLPAEWIKVHEARSPQARPAVPHQAMDAYRVLIQADARPYGTIWALRDRASGRPDRGATRLLALAADQLGLAQHRDELRREVMEAEIARQSDSLKTALLDSVSHDLRTPLSGIRAIAGSLMDVDLDLSEPQRREMAGEIDRAAERLGRFVRELLDVSRVQAGTLLPDLEIYPLRELVEPVIDRLRPSLGEREITIRIPDDLDPVVVDGVLFDEALTNVVDNAVQHAPAPAPVRLSARARPDDTVVVTFEDGGPGVAPGEHDRLFDRFYRTGSNPTVPTGLGIGLTVARGFVEAMHGQVEAGPSELGGLAITMILPAAPTDDEEPADAVPAAASDPQGRG